MGTIYGELKGWLDVAEQAARLAGELMFRAKGSGAHWYWKVADPEQLSNSETGWD